MSGQVNWYGEDVKLRLEDATADLLARAAFQIEAETKVNITSNGQVDTGFMRASVYGIAPKDADEAGGTDYQQAKASANGQNPDAEMARKPSVPDDGAAVCVGAAYAAYQEAQHPFLYPAINRVQRQMGGTVEQVARDRGLD